ncbi:YybS family protein [Paucisalibacillus globulus]|uniref:YybS family protein n=1 Tax=Paucisalibacillus globulus TaxID=351095 RepID=UPI0003F91D33|nr:YybS family protein [Paucisalibacillus globulus]
MNKSKQLTDGALLTVIFVVLLLINTFVPVLMVVLAVPFVIFAAKHNWKPSLIMLGVATILSMLFATIYSLPIPILAGLGGIMIGTAIYRERSAYETWARGTLGFVAGILFFFLFAFIMMDVNVIEEFNAQIDQSLDMSKQLILDFGMGEVSEEEFGLVERQVMLFKQLVPVIVVLASIFLALINQWVSYKILNRIERKQLHFPKFRNLRLPTAIIWIYLLAMVGTLFQMDSSDTVYIALQNVIMLTEFLLIFQGISFIFFYSHHKNISKAIPIITTIFVFLLPILLPLVRIIGIIDLGFGLRDRMVK